MADGKLYKANGSAWSKSKAMRGNGSRMIDTVIKHSNGSAWYDNFPMEQEYTQYFNVTWTQGYKASGGTKLDTATWGDHPRSGDTVDFIGMFGFDRTAMKNFVAGGIVKDLEITVYFDDPGHAGNPIVDFYPHVYTSEPASYSGYSANTNYKTRSQFNQTGSNYTRTINMPVGAWLNGNMGGIAIRGADNTPANSARFAGKTSSHGMSAYTSKIKITVLK